jgi:hypothetical protein
MKKFTGVLAVGALLVCALSLFLMVHHSGAQPECDGKRMVPGDVCRRIGASGGGTSSTYEEEKQSLADSVPVERAVALVSGAVFVIAGAGRLLVRSAPGR